MSEKMILECTDLEESIARGAADYDIEELIADLARTSDDEFDDLVKMYHKADLDLYKIRLAYALELVNYREIIPDLIKMLNIACTFDGFLIAQLLIKFDEDIGGQYLMKLHEINPKKFNYQYLWVSAVEYKSNTATKYGEIFRKLHLAEKENKKETVS